MVESKPISEKIRNLKEISSNVYSLTRKLLFMEPSRKIDYFFSARDVFPFILHKKLSKLFEMDKRPKRKGISPENIHRKTFELTKTYWDKSLGPALFRFKKHIFEKTDGIERPAVVEKISKRSMDALDRVFREKTKEKSDEFFEFLKERMNRSKFKPEHYGYENWEDFKGKYYKLFHNTIRDVFFYHFRDMDGFMSSGKSGPKGKYEKPHIFMKIMLDDAEETAAHEALHWGTDIGGLRGISGNPEILPLFVMNYFRPEKAKERLKLLEFPESEKEMDRDHHNATKLLKRLKDEGFTDKQILYIGFIGETPMYSRFIPHLYKLLSERDEGLDDLKGASEEKLHEQFFDRTWWPKDEKNRKEFDRTFKNLMIWLEKAHKK